MARGKRWTREENELLMRLVEKGMSAQEIFQSGKFSNRTVRAIDAQIKRLSIVSQKKKPIVPQIREAEIVGLDEIVKRYVDAFNQICREAEFTKEELERFRIIFMAAWRYRALFADYERLKQVEEEISELRKALEEIKAQLTRTAETNQG